MDNSSNATKKRLTLEINDINPALGAVGVSKGAVKKTESRNTTGTQERAKRLFRKKSPTVAGTGGIAEVR